MSSSHSSASEAEVELSAAKSNKVMQEGNAAKARLSLQQVAVVTLQTNPTISIAHWRREDAKAGVNITKAKYLPKIDYSLATGREVTYDTRTEIGEGHIRSEIGLSLSQLLFDFGKTGAEVDWSKALENSAQWRYKDQIEKILYEVSDIYLTVLELDMLLDNSNTNYNAHRETYRLVKLNEEAGNATVADVQKAATRLENAKTQSIEQASQRKRNESEFRRLTGMAPGRLVMPALPKGQRNFALGLSEDYVNRNPYLNGILSDIQSLYRQQESMQLAYLPRLTLEGAAAVKQNVMGVSPAIGDARLQIVLRGSIYDGGEKMAKLEQINARISENEARYREARRDLERDIRDTARIVSTAKTQRNTIERRIGASMDVVRLYTEQYKAGKRTIFEVLDAQQELYTAQAEQISNKFDVLRAQYSAYRIAGVLSKQLLGDINFD
ncbi:TolC family protein [Maritalea sp.]|uniref:TolC family protein n=1 Tax=Maritalea sp. TaxID=2003361 RepID=UPI003EF344CD